MASFQIPTTAFTLLLFFLLPATTVIGIVVDGDGNMVPNGRGEYHMRPYPSSEGAGPVGWVSEKDKCPLDITTSFTEDTHVSTITLSSPFKSIFIPEGPIFIQFNDKDTPCDETKPLWWFLKPSMGLDVHFLELAAGTDHFPSFSLVIEDANVEGKHVYQLKYCELGGTMCRYVVYKPDNSGAIGIIYGTNGSVPNGLRTFQFELTNAEKSYLKMRI